MLNLTVPGRIVRAVSTPIIQNIVDRSADGHTYIAGIPVLRVPTYRQVRRYLVREWGVTSVWGLFANLMKMAAVGVLVYAALIVLLAGGG